MLIGFNGVKNASLRSGLKISSSIKGFNFVYTIEFTIQRMEMRYPMFPEIHLDKNTVESCTDSPIQYPLV